MRRMLAAFVFVSLPLALTLAAAQSTGSGRTGPQLDAFDRSAGPCTDFYRFACGGWNARNPVPPDRASWGRFTELEERNLEILHRILDKAALGRDPDTRKIGDDYAACMDESAIDASGASPLQPVLKRIAALNRPADLAPLLAGLHAFGVNAFFTFGSEPDPKNATSMIAFVGQGGLGLPDRDYYFRDDPKSVELRQQYVEHVATMASLLGAAPVQASAAGQTVLRIETALARTALDAVSRRDPTRVYHPLARGELRMLSPAFDWTRYFTAATAPSFGSLNVSEPEFVKTVDQIVAGEPLADIQTYLRWHLVHASAAMLSTPFVDENFRFYGTLLTGASQLQPRWKRCVRNTDSDLGEALGKAFVNEAFGAQAKADTLKMVHQIEAALEQDIQQLTWMTDATKQQALIKLHAVTNKIGYPDRWRDYRALTILRRDALGNSERSNAFEFHRDVRRIGDRVDRSEWEMTPPTVNAYYDPQQNNINFPAGILQLPFYSPTRDAGVNFGAIGAVIGHELTHGFDDQGRQFDANGNLRDWWTPEDVKAFEERSACLVDEYSSFAAIDSVHVNGRLTLGENTADNGGLRLAMMAYIASLAGQEPRAIDGFTPDQRLFIGWAQIWCQNVRPETARLLAQTNPHAPARDRVNGVVSNMPEFQKAFSCPADAPMVRQPACRVW